MNFRDWMLGGGWALLTIGFVVALGFGWGCAIGGTTLFLTGVFGITPTKGT